MERDCCFAQWLPAPPAHPPDDQPYIERFFGTVASRLSSRLSGYAGLNDRDRVLVDRAITPAQGHVVIAVVEDEFVCRRLSRHGRDMRLRGLGIVCADILVDEGQAFQLWGVVTQLIHTMPT